MRGKAKGQYRDDLCYTITFRATSVGCCPHTPTRYRVSPFQQKLPGSSGFELGQQHEAPPIHPTQRDHKLGTFF